MTARAIRTLSLFITLLGLPTVAPAQGAAATPTPAEGGDAPRDNARDVVFVLESPAVTHCFEVRPEPKRAKLRVEHLGERRTVRAGEGVYEVTATPPREGVYMLFVESRSQGAGFGDFPHLQLTATKDGN